VPPLSPPPPVLASGLPDEPPLDPPELPPEEPPLPLPDELEPLLASSPPLLPPPLADPEPPPLLLEVSGGVEPPPHAQNAATRSTCRYSDRNSMSPPSLSPAHGASNPRRVKRLRLRRNNTQSPPSTTLGDPILHGRGRGPPLDPLPFDHDAVRAAKEARDGVGRFASGPRTCREPIER
jgi:hypothetical protein